MSQVEELLNSLTEDEIEAYTIDRATEPHIIVNPDRTITVPDELKTIAVQFDHNVETVVFDCPRFWDEHDLSTMQVFISYMTPDKKTALYPCPDVKVDEIDDTLMHFSWRISSNVTAREGTISFLIVIKDIDEEGYLSNRWSSCLNQEMLILKGMEADTEELVNNYPDMITEMVERINALENYPAYHRIHVIDLKTEEGEGESGAVPDIDLSTFKPGDILLVVDTNEVVV